MRRIGFVTLFALLQLQLAPAHAADSLKKLEIEAKIAEHKAKGDYEKALELLGYTIDVREKQGHPRDFLLAAALRERAALRQLAHDPVIDLASLWKAISIDNEVFGRDHPIVAADYLAIAEALVAAHQRAQAEEYYVRAFTILSTAYGPDHFETRAAYRKLVSVCGPILLSQR